MKILRMIFVLVAFIAMGRPAAAQDTFLRHFPGIDVDGTPELREGRRLFNLHFLDQPAGEEPGGGLGPLFNRNACSGCHPSGGRGSLPNGPDDPLLTALVRLSIPGKAENGGPLPHPGYGLQLNTRGIRGIPAEARVEITFETIEGRYADGTAYQLRRPRVGFADAAYGSLDDALTSLRIGQPIYGMGLLDMVPAEVIDAWADPEDLDGDGISGRVNLVWSAEFDVPGLGRFGWKANEPSLLQQTAAAFIGDIGITNAVIWAHDCGSEQLACRRSDVRVPELPDGGIFLVTDYLRTIAPPPRRNEDQAVVMRGERIFGDIGCAKCHRPDFGPVPADNIVVKSVAPFLAGRPVDAYTDLLLHDMGDGLADNRPDFGASGSEWRTPPLWGLGLTVPVHGRNALLHDGRARSIEEAILWHGGEAERARELFRTMPLVERVALVAFLNSL